MRIIAFLMALVFGFSGLVSADNALTMTNGHDTLTPNRSLGLVNRLTVRSAGSDVFDSGISIFLREGVTPGVNIFVEREYEIYKDKNPHKRGIDVSLETLLGSEFYGAGNFLLTPRTAFVMADPKDVFPAMFVSFAYRLESGKGSDPDQFLPVIGLKKDFASSVLASSVSVEASLGYTADLSVMVSPYSAPIDFRYAFRWGGGDNLSFALGVSKIFD